MLVFPGLHVQQHRAGAYNQAGGDAGDAVEAPGIGKGFRKRVRKIQPGFLKAPDKAEEHDARRRDKENQNGVEAALFRQAELIKGQLQLHPAQKHAECAGTGNIADQLQ